MLKKLAVKLNEKICERNLARLRKEVNSLQNKISRETDKYWKEYFTVMLEADEQKIKCLQKEQEMWRKFAIDSISQKVIVKSNK